MSDIWMATEKYGQWVPCPRINMKAGKVAWGSVTKNLNGGTYVRRSAAGAKEYTVEWGLKSRDLLRPILDFADGMYGTGDIYFCDPMAMDKNVLPSYWAEPYLNGLDGPLAASTWGSWPPTTTGVMTGVARPTVVSLTTSTEGFPTYSGGIKGLHSLFIPVPIGYTFYLSIHHTTSGAGGAFKVQPMVSGVNSGASSLPAISALTGSVLATYSYAASVNHAGVMLSNTADVNYTGMMAQILKTGTAANTTIPFVSGQGHSGLQFVAPGVDYYEYSSALDMVQASATLVEVGAWR